MPNAMHTLPVDPSETVSARTLDRDIDVAPSHPGAPGAARARDALPRRIALLTDAWFPQVNGVVRTWSTVVERLEAEGRDVLVVNPSMFRTCPLPRYPEIRLSILPGRRMAKLLDDFRPEAIHIATEGPIGLAGRAYCRRRAVTFTTSFHTHFAKYGRSYFLVPPNVSYAVLRWFHGPAAATLVPTPSVVRELHAEGMRHLVTWTRGVDTTLFRLRPKTLYADLERPVFLYCGRVAREKNIEAFLDADLPGTKVIVGDGPAAAAMQRRNPGARFVGYKQGEALAEHFASADVFVFPSRTDTFGVVMLEAMACGLPVAAYPVTGPIDVVRPGVTGVLDEDLATAATKALDLDPDDCRAQALEYSWDRCARIALETFAPIG